MTSLIAMRRRAMKVVAAIVSGGSDSFNRPNNTTTMGNADTGQTWEPNSGTWGIDANRAYLVSATSQATTVADWGLADGTVEVTYALVGTSSGTCFRSTDDANNFVTEVVGGGAGIYRRQAGAFTLISTLSSGSANGDVWAIVLAGASINVKRNGVSQGQATDAFNAAATRQGLRTNGSTAARFENFSVTA